MKTHANGGLEFLAQIIIETAMDENGKRMFRQSDMPRFLGQRPHRGIDPDVITRIGNHLSQVIAGMEMDEIEKNSEAIPSSTTDS